ncbi:DoxX family protein [Candidatus Kaiserbacteria bacterium]|nr:DoxX family protein [Candidatus Kaiserbacteria bacterium]
MHLMLSREHRLLLRKNGITAARIALGMLFFFTGLGMLFKTGGLGFATSLVSSLGLPMGIATMVAFFVALIKIIAGASLMAGYRTGLAAAILIGFTFLATILVHLDLDDVNLFKNLAIIGGLLYAMSYGPGDGWSIPHKGKKIYESESDTAHRVETAEDRSEPFHI